LMTKKERRWIGMVVWKYLRDHPEVETKECLPPKIYKLISNLIENCPLCGLYIRDDGIFCPECPLKSCGVMSDYRRWLRTKRREPGNSDRSEYAGNIYNKIKAWKV